MLWWSCIETGNADAATAATAATNNLSLYLGLFFARCQCHQSTPSFGNYGYWWYADGRFTTLVLPWERTNEHLTHRISVHARASSVLGERSVPRRPIQYSRWPCTETEQSGIDLQRGMQVWWCTNVERYSSSAQRKLVQRRWISGWNRPSKWFVINTKCPSKSNRFEQPQFDLLFVRLIDILIAP